MGNPSLEKTLSSIPISFAVGLTLALEALPLRGVDKRMLVGRVTELVKQLRLLQGLDKLQWQLKVTRLGAAVKDVLVVHRHWYVVLLLCLAVLEVV